jgi:hypothetical protein
MCHGLPHLQNAAVAVQAAIQEMGWRGRVHKNTVRMWCIIIGAIFALLSYMLLHSLKVRCLHSAVMMGMFDQLCLVNRCTDWQTLDVFCNRWSYVALQGWLDRVAGDYASFLMFVAPSL